MSDTDTNDGLAHRILLKLVQLDIETPGAGFDLQLGMPRILGAITSFRAFMADIGIPTDVESTADTPERVAKMFINEFLYGMDYRHFPEIRLFQMANIDRKSFVLQSGIPIQSICEHHMLPIVGTCKVAYCPRNGMNLGLSKLNRIVNFFCRRPQLQERLAAQIMVAIQLAANTDSVAVCIVANHCCVQLRGVHDQSEMSSLVTSGDFFDDAGMRNDFIRKLA